MAGGGGYGDPLQRDPQCVLKDVIEEKVGIDLAEGEYGVVILESANGLIIDNDATTATRQSMELES